MIVVADSGPLHYLILLDQTELLERLYGQIVLPQAVFWELTSQKTPQPVKDWISGFPPWCRVESAPPDRLELITDDLDPGEREAIALAHFLHADLLLLDERLGRSEARRRGLRVTGTLGILRAAAERDWIDVPEVLARLRETTFYVEESLIRSIFSEWLGEDKASGSTES